MPSAASACFSTSSERLLRFFTSSMAPSIWASVTSMPRVLTSFSTSRSARTPS